MAMSRDWLDQKDWRERSLEALSYLAYTEDMEGNSIAALRQDAKDQLRLYANRFEAKFKGRAAADEYDYRRDPINQPENIR